MEATMIGQYVSVFEVSESVVGLRRTANTVLASRGMKHKEVAASVGVSSVYWARILAAPRLTPKEFEIVARGLGMTPEQLIEACQATCDKEASL